jgi:predicted protein tyrosine phosphatase
MKEVVQGLYIGAKNACQGRQSEFATVHACKHPCHKNAVGFSGRSPDKSNPHYLYKREESDLFLNMVDADEPKFFGDELFEQAMGFMAEQWEIGSDILVHCSKGRSRAPSIGLLFLASQRGEISTDSFEDARRDFEEMYPAYAPNSGIERRLRRDWEELLAVV